MNPRIPKRPFCQPVAVTSIGYNLLAACCRLRLSSVLHNHHRVYAGIDAWICAFPEPLAALLQRNAYGHSFHSCSATIGCFCNVIIDHFSTLWPLVCTQQNTCMALSVGSYPACVNKPFKLIPLFTCQFNNIVFCWYFRPP